MSHELSRAIRSVYDEIDNSETGQPTTADIDRLFLALQGRGDTLRVTAMWSAARALAFPQVPTASVEPCARAFAAMRDRMAAGSRAVIPIEINAFLESHQPSKTWEARQFEARRCLGYAFLFCIDPTLTRFGQVIESMRVAQQDEVDKPTKARQRWIGWLDDVVSRSDRFRLDTILDLTERALRGTLALLPGGFRWEATADDTQQLHVWAADPRSRELVMLVMTLEPLKLKGHTLVVTVLAKPDLVRDPLRIEYLVEEWVHRQFLGGMYYGRYDHIDYQCLSTGEHWQAPA